MVLIGKKKVKFDFNFILYLKVYFRLMVDADMKDKTMKLLEENNGDDFYDFFKKEIFD